MMNILLSFNFYPIVIVFFLVAVDLGLRFWIFGRLESAAIDIAVFALLYCGTEAARYYNDGPKYWGHLGQWLARGAIVLLLIVGMGIIHARASVELNEKIDELIEHVRNKSKLDPVKTNNILMAAKPVIRRSVLLTFAPPSSALRPGKKNWRKEATDLVNLLAEQGSDCKLSQEDLVLPFRWQLGGGIFFGFCAVISALLIGLPLM